MEMAATLDRAALKRKIRVRALRYMVSFAGPLLAWVSFTYHGWLSWALVIQGFVLVPVIELMHRPRHLALSEEEESAALDDPLYDVLLYVLVPMQWALLVYFLFSVGQPDLTLWERIGRTASMGILCGVYGINVAHELGHRARRWERDLARALLLTSLYTHFIIEHNRGHHKRVATPEDPASARYGESVYAFWIRTLVFSFLSAWGLERARLHKEGHAIFSLRNEMLRGLLFEAMLMAVIGYFFGWQVLLAFLIAAFIGMLLLETVNYIEHYGLQRVRTATGTFGRVQHVHSWNSDLLPGRIFLFELTRHSDHHYKASRKYQILASSQTAPQLPAGYPGMMILSLIPPLWFAVMNKRVVALAAQEPEVVLAQT